MRSARIGRARTSSRSIRSCCETCDVFLGFKLIPDAYPDWLTITRGYYRGSYVFVTADAGWKSLADVPLSRVIGGTIGTSADIRLIQYLEALQPPERWSHYPMGSDETALRDVASGELAAALVWGPSFWALQKTDPAFAKLRIIAPKPLPRRERGCRGRDAHPRDLPARQPRSGDRRLDGGRNHREHSQELRLPRGAGTVVL